MPQCSCFESAIHTGAHPYGTLCFQLGACTCCTRIAQRTKSHATITASQKADLHSALQIITAAPQLSAAYEAQWALSPAAITAPSPARGGVVGPAARIAQCSTPEQLQTICLSTAGNAALQEREGHGPRMAGQTSGVHLGCKAGQLRELNGSLAKQGLQYCESSSAQHLKPVQLQNRSYEH